MLTLNSLEAIKLFNFCRFYLRSEANFLCILLLLPNDVPGCFREVYSYGKQVISLRNYSSSI